MWRYFKFFETFFLLMVSLINDELKVCITKAGIMNSGFCIPHLFSEFLQPYKERPQTTKLTAYRMVTGALGVKSHMTREERSKEREKLKEARGKY